MMVGLRLSLVAKMIDVVLVSCGCISKRILYGLFIDWMFWVIRIFLLILIDLVYC